MPDTTTALGPGRAAETAARQSASGRSLAAGISVLAIAAVLAPIIENWRALPKDSFPLSYYPMFAAKRGATARCTYLIGLDADGGRRCLPHTLAGTGGLNQVRRQLNRAGKRKDRAAICRKVAARVGKNRMLYPDIVAVRFMAGEYCLKSYCAGVRAPLTETILAEAPVPGHPR